MADIKYGLRTVSRVGLFRQISIPGSNPGDPPTLGLAPIPIVTAPTTIAIVPGDEPLELPGVNCKGEEIIELTLTKGYKPELNMEFSSGAPEIDSLIHGRLMTSASNVAGFVFFETVAQTNALAARVSGEAGYEVVAQAANSSAQVYRIDPATKLAQKISIVGSSSTPAGDQIKIGAAMSITFSPEIVASGAVVRGWVPCTFAQATIISADSLGLLTVYGMGVDFDGKFAGLIARNCSRLPSGGQISQDPKKTAKLRILPDPNDGNGLGFIMQYTNQKVVC